MKCLWTVPFMKYNTAKKVMEWHVLNACFEISSMPALSGDFMQVLLASTEITLVQLQISQNT